MNLLELLLTAFALAVDAFTVSVASGLSAKRFHLRHAITLGVWFGGFQTIMPVLGWLSGAFLQNWICAFDHWAAFVLLAFIGARMIHESFKLKETRTLDDLLAIRVLFALAVATSLDAYAVGVSLALIRGGLITMAAVIGIVAFLASIIGVWIGACRFRQPGVKMESVGGIILIALGLKILVEHLIADSFL